MHRTTVRTAALVAPLLALAGCGSSSAPAQSSTPAAITLTSSAFADSQTIPAQYTCSGTGTIPPLSWTGVPKDTAWLALYMEDTSAADLTHWYTVEIPAGTTGVTEGQQPQGHIVTTYLPPCPEGGTEDDYVFTIYALPKGYSPTKIGKVIAFDPTGLHAHAIGEGTLTGTFYRKL